MSAALTQLRRHVRELSTCDRCPDMIGPVVSGNAVQSPVMLIGQAPGPHEGKYGKPFAWTAGKTLFNWFDRIGIDEHAFRENVYMAAVCRCFPGKNPKGGDRVPSKVEIANCSQWMATEVELLSPKLVLPVGKLAISQLMPVGKLVDVIGVTHRVSMAGRDTDVIPLPHPSGASTWHRTEPGKTLLARALDLVAAHPAWQEIQP